MAIENVQPRRARKPLANCFLFLGLLGINAIPALAQNAIVTGEVLDSSGGVVPHAKVALTDSQTNVALHATTNNAGLYNLPTVPPGEYTLSVEAGGFARFEQTAISVQPRQNLTFDVRLTVENASQSVTVRGDNHPLEQAPMMGKTGTKLEDLPSSVEIINRDLVDAQGGIALKDTLHNASGVGQGGSDSFGFGDRFLIRGLDARIYNDGFSDGDQRNGIPHSLNGVEHVEVLEGPGSSMFGSGPPGGTINVVHYLPSPTLLYGGTFETGSFGTVSGNAYVTGPTGIQGLNFRVDALAQRSDGFRSLKSGDYEIRPELSWTLGKHLLTFTIDARDLQATPDPAGLIYVNGAPIKGVSREAMYSTPFGHGDQTLLRTTLADFWSVKPYLTITNRFSYMYRNLLILRNGDGGTVTGDVFSGRQLRAQHDVLNDFDYQFEPVWTFRTGRIKHTVLTGFELQHQSINTNRATADLPNITNIYDPVVPETSTAWLDFLRNAKHSGDIDDLSATYFSTYVADQIDVTDRLKVRLSGRKDWWDTDLTPQIFVPGRII